MKARVWAAAGAMAMVLASCGGNETKDANPVMEFQEYDFRYVGELPEDMRADDMSGLVSCEGYGIMPLRIGDNDLQALRDSLGRLGGFNVNDRLEAVPETLEGISLRPAEAGDTITAGSNFTSKLTIAMLTPKVIVWRGFSTEMMEGAAHGTYSTLYLNYNVAENKVIQLADLFVANVRPQLLERIRERLRDNEDVFSPAEAPLPGVFQITPGGLQFVYGLYDIAPYSAGEVTVDFDIYELEDLLSEQGKAIFEIQ